jgi:4-aminobutyrate aminotransferase-like enzyme
VPNIERAGGDNALTGLEHLGGRASVEELLAKHDRGRRWADDELRDAHRQHALFGWAAHSPASHDSALSVSHGEGVFLVENGTGRKIFDMNAGGMCNSLGHTLAPEIVDEITEQLRTLTYTWPDNTITPVRARLSSLLAAVLPGDLDHFMFPSGGAEANEACVRIARAVTGRQKVLSSYRSYHGGTFPEASEPERLPLLLAVVRLLVRLLVRSDSLAWQAPRRRWR